MFLNFFTEENIKLPFKVFSPSKAKYIKKISLKNPDKNTMNI